MYCRQTEPWHRLDRRYPVVTNRTHVPPFFQTQNQTCHSCSIGLTVPSWYGQALPSTAIGPQTLLLYPFFFIFSIISLFFLPNSLFFLKESHVHVRYSKWSILPVGSCRTWMSEALGEYKRRGCRFLRSSSSRTCNQVDNGSNQVNMPVYGLNYGYMMLHI